MATDSHPIICKNRFCDFGLGMQEKCHKNNKSLAVAEMGDRGHNEHGPKKGGAAVRLSRGSWVPI